MLQEIDKIIEKPKSTEALSKPTEKTPKSSVKTRSKRNVGNYVLKMNQVVSMNIVYSICYGVVSSELR